MKENLTQIVFILDRSGSMANLTSDTIGGYNAFLQTQKEQDGEAIVTTVLFDDKYEILHDAIDIKDVEPLTYKDYCARGLTALLDAIGKTINDVGDKLNKMSEEDRPSKVIFVITTDGQENASVEFKRNNIKDMITHQQEKYNWEFIFLGANIDAVAEAESIGILGSNASSYTASSIGTASLYESMSKTVSNYRSAGTIDASWKDEVR
jgi:uncharacterized protein YegL